jgi:hypothetical protein
LINLAVALIGAAILDKAVWRIIPSHSLSAIVWKEIVFSICFAVLIGFAMWVRSSGKTSLGIAQLIVRGSVYILKDTGAGAALKPGVGDAAEFNSGQTLEMWFGSDSIYERVPDSDALSQKQK